MSARKPENNNSKLSFQKPHLYITIVILYLMSSLVVSYGIVFYEYVSWQESIEDNPASNDGPGRGLIPLIPVVTIIWLLFFSVPTVIGIIKLFQKKKSGVYLSFFTIVLIALATIMNFGLVLSDFTLSGSKSPLIEFGGFFLIGITIFLTVLMYVFLIKCLKEITFK